MVVLTCHHLLENCVTFPSLRTISLTLYVSFPKHREPSQITYRVSKTTSDVYHHYMSSTVIPLVGEKVEVSKIGNYRTGFRRGSRDSSGRRRRLVILPQLSKVIDRGRRTSGRVPGVLKEVGFKTVFLSTLSNINYEDSCWKSVVFCLEPPICGVESGNTLLRFPTKCTKEVHRVLTTWGKSYQYLCTK